MDASGEAARWLLSTNLSENSANLFSLHSLMLS